MIEKTKRIYQTVEELKEAIRTNNLHVNDEFVTTDIDGEAVFICIKIGKKKVHFLRKYVLTDTKPMKNDGFDLRLWLNEDYRDTFPDDLKDVIKKVNLIKEKEMFGENKYGMDENCEQIEWFKNTKHRIATAKLEDEYSHWYWLQTPYRASSAYFCRCGNAGDGNYGNASNADGYVRPRFILAKCQRSEI